MGSVDEAKALMYSASDRLQTETAGAADAVRQTTSEVSGYLAQAGDLVREAHEAGLSLVSDLATQMRQNALATAEAIRAQANALGHE
jgi:hypothetical protein